MLNITEFKCLDEEELCSRMRTLKEVFVMKTRLTETHAIRLALSSSTTNFV